MRLPFLRTLLVAILSITLLAPAAFAKSEVASSPLNGGGTSETPELAPHLQLLAYVAELLSAGAEVPKALLNKIAAFAKHQN